MKQIMYNNLLLQRKSELETLIDDLCGRLCLLPEGTLIVRNIRGKKRYYQKHAEKEEYLGNNKKEIIKGLIESDYLKSLIFEAENELYYVNKLLLAVKDYHPNEVVLPPELKDEPIISALWQRKMPQFDAPVDLNLITANGEYVRSKSEIIIANCLHANGVPYYYEKTIRLKNGKWVKPDFTVLNKSTGKEYLWEHFGMLSDSKYVKDSFIDKIKLYEQNGFFPGENLIMTFECENSGLNSKFVELQIKHYLL